MSRMAIPSLPLAAKTICLCLCVVLFASGCDQVSGVTSGVSDRLVDLKNKISSKFQDDETSDEQVAKPADEPVEQEDSEDAKSDDESAEEEPRATVKLNAFKDFRCSDEWTTRDGALGLRPGSGSGVCLTTFPGVSGSYRVVVLVQTEFDGAPRYEVSVNDKTIKKGTYPYSTGKLVCDCPNWQVNCPDKVVGLGAGTRELKTNDVIEFYGEEVYPCDPEHGAYAKWQGMEFQPAD